MADGCNQPGGGFVWPVRSDNRTTKNTESDTMKKLLMVLCFTCALALVAQAEPEKKEGKKREAPTAEQKAARKALLEKYDANKDGKLDKEERAKITEEERKKAGYAKPGEGKKGEGKKKKEKN